MKIFNMFFLVITFLSINIFAADNIATITAIKGSAVVERGDATIKAIIGTKLEEKDAVVTKEDSKLQIIFKDDTIISLGKNSRFSIEEYLFEENQEPVAKFGMLKGAMKTITGRIGKIAPQKFTVIAKTSIIGIRGTNFIVVVNDDNSYQAYCTYGAISVTISGEVHIIKQGFFISVSPNGNIEIKKFTPKDLKNIEKNKFGEDNTKKDNLSLDSELMDDGQLDMSLGKDGSMLIEDISGTLSDIQRPVVQEPSTPNDSPLGHPEHGFTP